MSKTFRAWKIDEPLFLPPMVGDFVAKDHLARFVLSLVRDDLGLGEITGTYGSERGQPPFDPTMMTALLLYSYCCGIYSSRRIAKACRERVDFMSIVALDAPDFRTVSDFRKRHLKALGNLFKQILQNGKRGKKREVPQPQRVSLPGCPAGLTLAGTSASAPGSAKQHVCGSLGGACWGVNIAPRWARHRRHIPTQLRAARELGRRWAIEAKTIHRLLEVDPKSGGFKRGDDNPLDCNLLVVDETRPHRRGSYVPTPDKKHRVAVTRALRRMELPPLWRTVRLNRSGAEHCLDNAGSLEEHQAEISLGWMAAGQSLSDRARPEGRGGCPTLRRGVGGRKGRHRHRPAAAAHHGAQEARRG